VRWAFYVVIIVAWVAAFLYSLRQYLQDREHESADYVSSVAGTRPSDSDDDKAAAPA
jgi:uncharacterized membrane protein